MGAMCAERHKSHRVEFRRGVHEMSLTSRQAAPSQNTNTKTKNQPEKPTSQNQESGSSPHDCPDSSAAAGKRCRLILVESTHEVSRLAVEHGSVAAMLGRDGWTRCQRSSTCCKIERMRTQAMTGCRPPCSVTSRRRWRSRQQSATPILLEGTPRQLISGAAETHRASHVR